MTVSDARARSPAARILPAIFDRAIAAAVVGAVAIAFSAIFVRLADVSPETAALFRCLYALPALAVLARREDRELGPRPRAMRRVALVAGALLGADLVLWHHTIAAVGAGLATVLANLQVVVVGFIAWIALGEAVQARVVACVPLAVGGIVLVSGVFEADAYGADPALGVVLGVLTALAYSAFILLLRHGGRDLRRPAGPLLDATLAAAMVAAAVGAVAGSLSFPRAPSSHGWLIALALTSQVLGWLLITISLPRLPAALGSLLLTIQPVGSVVLGIVLLGEDPSALQLVGAALILAAVVIATVRRAPAEPPA